MIERGTNPRSANAAFLPELQPAGRPVTECLTPLSVALGLAMWAVIALLLRHLA